MTPHAKEYHLSSSATNVPKRGFMFLRETEREGHCGFLRFFLLILAENNFTAFLSNTFYDNLWFTKSKRKPNGT